MALMDSQGRVVGRVNVVDLLVASAIVLALPFGYAAYLLWRAPGAELTETVPAAVVQAPDAQVEIHGRRFRPYMRVSFGDTQAPAFHYVSEGVAVVPVPPLPPGTYDVILYDYSREASRLRGALTVQPPAAPRAASIEIDGAFIGLADSQIPLVVAGMPVTHHSTDALLRVGTPVPAVARLQTAPDTTLTLPIPRGRDVPATLRITCLLNVDQAGTERCSIGTVAVTTDAVLSLPALGGSKFRVDRVRAPEGRK
jgi:hypothetical protein